MAKQRGHYTKHPSVYIDDFNEPHLDIFRNFFVESQLPKFQKLDDDMKSMMEAKADSVIGSNESDSSSFIPSWKRKHNKDPYNYERSVANSLKETKKPSFWEVLKSKISRRDRIEDSFDKVKKNMKFPTTSDLQSAQEASEKLIKILHESGQYSQEDKVKEYLSVLKGEIVLIKNGFEKYLTEQDIIDFMLKADKGVSITFLRYFSNILPLEVAKKKIEADRLLVFDNYVVMFYDPGIDPFRFIKEQEVQRITRDPILFGMIEDSDKLYYITDWIYQDDDLTMEKVETMLGRKAQFIKDSKINDTQISINEFLSNVDNIRDALNNN